MLEAGLGCETCTITMLSDFDLIGTIDDTADVAEDEESGSDDEVSKHHMGSDCLIGVVFNTAS